MPVGRLAGAHPARFRPRRSRARSIRGNGDTFSKLLLFSVALFACSLGTLYVLAFTRIGDALAVPLLGKVGTAAVAAVVVANTVIGLYVWSAFSEPADARPKRQ